MLQPRCKIFWVYHSKNRVCVSEECEHYLPKACFPRPFPCDGNVCFPSWSSEWELGRQFTAALLLLFDLIQSVIEPLRLILWFSFSQCFYVPTCLWDRCGRGSACLSIAVNDFGLCSYSTEFSFMESFKPGMPPACCERACAAVSPVSVQPITRELSSHVWISDFTGRAPVWRKHGNLCWQKKQLGKRLEYFCWNACSEALALDGKHELCLWISMLCDPSGENLCPIPAHLLSSLFCTLLSLHYLSWTRFPEEYLCFDLMLVRLIYRWKLWKLLKKLCSVMWKFGLALKVLWQPIHPSLLVRLVSWCHW